MGLEPLSCQNGDGDWNWEWAVFVERTPDEDLQIWFTAYIELYDDVQEQLTLHATSKIMSKKLEEQQSDKGSEEGEEVLCAHSHVP